MKTGETTPWEKEEMQKLKSAVYNINKKFT